MITDGQTQGDDKEQMEKWTKILKKVSYGGQFILSELFLKFFLSEKLVYFVGNFSEYFIEKIPTK